MLESAWIIVSQALFIMIWTAPFTGHLVFTKHSQPLSFVINWIRIKTYIGMWRKIIMAQHHKGSCRRRCSWIIIRIRFDATGIAENWLSLTLWGALKVTHCGLWRTRTFNKNVYSGSYDDAKDWFVVINQSGAHKSQVRRLDLVDKKLEDHQSIVSPIVNQVAGILVATNQLTSWR